MSEFYNRQNAANGDYVTLGTYNSNGTMAPVPSSVPSMRQITVPVHPGYGYESLTNGNVPNIGGYMRVSDSYGKQCYSYATRQCFNQ